ncbi:MAG: SMC-Scp complex subunit ScpB [Candidatus Hodarchaeota archaeon]
MRKFNHQKVVEALLILRGESGISVNDIYKITKINDLEYNLYLLNLIENSLINSPLFLKFNPAKKRYFLALPNEFYSFLSEQDLIKSILPKSVLATLACIIIEMEEGTVNIEKLKQLRGKTVVNHLKTLENEGFITVSEGIIIPTNKLLTKVNINQIIKGMKEI